MRLLNMLLVPLALCGAGEAELRRLIARGGDVRLPAGEFRITREIVIPQGARVTGAHTTVRMARAFRGRAAFVCSSGVTLENVVIYGNRNAADRPVGIAPWDRTFVSFYEANGVVVNGAERVVLRNLEMSGIRSFAVIVAASRDVAIHRVRVFDSGSLNANGRNNTTGGILLEEGTSGFVVRGCDLRRIRGNGVWTHSMYTSARNGPGVIEGNRFEDIGRDALQAGHATGVRVVQNTGRRIGWPVEIVDVEGGGTPVAIDTAGNVDKSAYEANRFEEINGKCIDLDGFHDGDVRENVCVNQGRAADYPFGHYGIVFNNTNPDMRSERIRVTGNVIDGTKFGGIFVIGRGHEVTGNTLTRLNLARCNDTAGCVYDKDQPDLLRSGIYLGAKAERPDPSRENVITGNRIEGHGMDRYCVTAAPGIELRDQKIGKNECKSR